MIINTKNSMGGSWGRSTKSSLPQKKYDPVLKKNSSSGASKPSQLKQKKSDLVINKLTSQQIKAIKDSPKGVLPKFITGGVYNTKNVVSVGGKIGKVGGTIGYDKKVKKAFGSYNVSGKVKKSFGPQGY